MCTNHLKIYLSFLFCCLLAISAQTQNAPPLRPFESTLDIESGSDDEPTFQGTEYYYDSIPKRVPDIELDPKRNDWYRYQAVLWKKKLTQNPLNPAAWLNLFRSLKYLKYPESALDSIHSLMKVNIPNSAERYLADFMTLNTNTSLLKAFQYADSSLKSELFPEICLYDLIQQQNDSLKIHLNEWKNSGALTLEALTYAYNMLITCRPNSILILSDFYEFWPAKYLQVNGFRNDITLISLQEVTNLNYYNSIKKSSCALPVYSTDNKHFLEHFVHLNAGTPLFLSMALPKILLRPLGPKLQCEGLAYFYGDYNSLSVYRIEENIKDVYNLNYLENELSASPLNQTYYSRLNLNYIIPLLQVYDIYVYKDKAPDGIKYYDLALKIAKRKGLGDLVIGYRFSK